MRSAPVARALRASVLPRLLLPLLLLLAAAGGWVPSAHAQAVAVSDTLVEVRLADGSTLYGRVVEVEGDRIVLETQAGARVEVQRAQIRSIRPLRGQVRGGEVWPDDPHATRLFFAPTGRSLSAGEAYVGVYELFFPFVTYGATDRLVLAGGTPIIPGAIGEFAYVGPKLLIVSQPRMQLSGGVFTGIFDEGLAGIAYGVGTFGDRDNALTVGAGYGFWAGNGDSGTSDRPLVMVGGETRVGRRAKLLTENYFVPGESGAVISGGVRIWGERLSADAGLGTLVGEECSDWCVLPVVNFVYSFGGAR